MGFLNNFGYVLAEIWLFYQKRLKKAIFKNEKKKHKNFLFSMY
jgi:hypothetical protein